ncbi:MAG: pyridoxal-phosphate dependent enzyme, partial [Phycisphaerales bacterium]|nr:pyridoxal-phosphate dependent enzyme [Phycisphaerales bacterium]
MTPDLSLCDAVTFDNVRDASTRLEGVVHRTPVATSRTLDAMAGCDVFLKCENLQRVGAFKIRGGYNALSRLPDTCRGVLTYSSGNHAQAVALSAQLLQIPAIVIMPSDAPRMKKVATAAYLEGAPGDSRVVEYDRATTTREALASSMVDDLGYTIVPPYDHPHVIAGQGTAALELFEEVGTLDALFIPCGGGGLMTGSATAARAMSPGCRVIGVEPEAGDDA